MGNENNTYTTNLETVAQRIEEQMREADKNKEFKEMQERARDLLESVHGIARNKPLIIYGEQADPLTIKNAGKSLLASIIGRRLVNEGVQATNLYLPLFNDIFGSNAEVFIKLRLLGSKQVNRLGRQTYTFAPVVPEYVEALLNNIDQDHPKRREQLEDLGVAGDCIQNLAKAQTLGNFNVALRERLEEPIQYGREIKSLSPFEDAVIRDKELLAKLLEFSNITGSKAPLYVVWRTQEPEIARHGRVSRESGYRRCRVFLKDENAVVADPETNKPLAAGTLESLFDDQRAYQFSLNAGCRAALLYAISIPGAYIVGGGSTYNEGMIKNWCNEKKFPMPILAYISSPAFMEGSFRLALDLPGKAKDVNRMLAEAKKINRADDQNLIDLASWRAP